MTIEIRNNGEKDITVIAAEDGKVFRRIGTDDVFGNEVWIGKSWYINGEKLEEPHLDIPEDFEEIDAPEEQEEEQEMPFEEPIDNED